MRKFFTLVLATVAATTLASAAVQQTSASVDCGTSKTIVATPATGYHFVRWEKDGVAIQGDATLTVTNITADATYEAIFAITEYTIRFLNGTDVLQTSTVEHGQTPVYNGATPTKAATAQYTYSFNTWSPAIAVATQDQDYVATFTPTLRSYTITFKNGDEVLQTGSVAYGETPVYNGATPTKEATAQYTYTFAGWDSEITSVTGEKTYNATFSQTLRSYTITFKNGDEVLQTGSVAYGETPVYNGATPTKEATAQYTYTFAGWDSEITSVTGEKTYNATFSQTLRSYTITFKNGDEVLQTGSVAYGETPVYDEATNGTPTKASDADYNYVWNGWTPAISSVTGEAVYVAKFDAVAKDEFVISAVVDPVGKGTVTGAGTYKEGASVTLTAESDDACYVFEKWMLGDQVVGTNASLTITVSATASYTAVFRVLQHTITIKSSDDTKGTVSFQ